MKLSAISYYYDNKLENRVPVNEEGGAIIDWGECNAGKTKTIRLYAKNELSNRIALRQPYTEDPEFMIKTYPTNLKPGEIDEVILEYSPNIDRLIPLKAGWGFEVLIG